MTDREQALMLSHRRPLMFSVVPRTSGYRQRFIAEADRRLENSREADRVRGAGLLHLVRQADLTQRRAATAGLPGVRRAGFEAGLGLKRSTWLTFRRTYSSWAHDKGVPGKVVAQLMGHAKVDTTLNVYTQVIDGALRAAVDKVGSELFTIVHNPERGVELTH